MGNCLAGDGCPFSHNPSSSIGGLHITDGASQSTSSPQTSFQLENSREAFPALQPSGGSLEQWPSPYSRKHPNHVLVTDPNGSSSPLASGRRSNGMTASRPHSRPTSRHQQRDMNPSPLSVDDPEAFPTLSAVSAKTSGKKHHGKRGGHNNNKDIGQSSLADLVRMSPSQGAVKIKGAKPGKESIKARELSAAAMAIPAPKNIPWLETGARANQQYIKYRTEAIRHGTVRNKFLQR